MAAKTNGGKDKATGHFLPGNRFWEVRSTHGRKPIFASPDVLWTAACEYFAWADANPLWESKAFAYQGEVTISEVPKMRAMTVSGLCLFLDISQQGWNEYRGKPDFSDVCARIDDVIRSQKFAGAAADLLNASIIARDLGLVEKTELAGDPVNPIRYIHTIERRVVRPDDTNR